MKTVSLLLLVTFLVVPAVARAWLNITAHPAINTEALAYFFTHEGSGEKYKYSPVDRTTGYTGTGVLEGGWADAPNGLISKNITGWLAHGGYSADEPEVFASLRHFYDPLALNGGAPYLTDHIDEFYPSENPEMDAKTWGLTADDNLYCWKKGLQSYKYAMEKTDSREANLTFAYRALGETMHLIADMTQPAHVRNDSHPWSEPIEDNVTGVMVTEVKDDPVDSRVSLDGLPGDLFDQLATFTNSHFYSNDTIFDGPSNILPYNGLAHYPSPQFKDLTYDPARRVYSGTFNGWPVPMIEQTASSYVLQKLGLGSPKYHVPPSYASGLAAVLIPIAIHANAKMVDMFFPTINLALKTTNIGNNRVHLEGEMTHDITKDSAWQELGMGPIKYAGPGAVMSLSSGKASKVADVIFDKGVMTPIDIDVPLSGGSSLYLQVTAGGRVFTSPPPTSITISPASVTLSPGGTQTFTATVTGTKNTAVTWSVKEGAPGGTITSGGVYTAPNTAGTYHVVATSQADPTKTATATVTVTVAGVGVTISPETVTVSPGGTQTFTGTVTGTKNTAVTWSVKEGAPGGTITSGGVYTAPNTAGTYHVVATSQADPTKTATATVNVVTVNAPMFTSIHAWVSSTDCYPIDLWAGNWNGIPIVHSGNSFSVNGTSKQQTGDYTEVYTVSLSGTINQDLSISVTGAFKKTQSGGGTSSELTSAMAIERVPRISCTMCSDCDSMAGKWCWVAYGKEGAQAYLKGFSGTYTETFSDGTVRSCTMTQVWNDASIGADVW